MAVYSAVDCAEEHNTVSEDFDIETGMSAQVTLRCAWNDRHALAADILGNSRIYPGTGFASPPQAATASIVPGGECAVTVGQGLVYDHALVTVGYSTKIKDLISESLEPNIEFITQDFERFRWGAADGDPLLKGEAPGKQYRSMNLVRTLYNLSAMPAAVLTAIGEVNEDEYTSAILGFTFDPETLLYQPPQLSRVIRTNGSDGWTLTMKFSYKPQGWNKYWRAKTQDWDSIFLVDPPGEYKNYPLGDFATLLY